MPDREPREEDVRDSGWRVLHPVIMAVPPSARQLTGREKVQALGLHARTALARSARHSGVELGTLKKGYRGAPLPSRGVYWSLSHTSDYVAAVTAPYRVGIDIEKIKSFTAALKGRLAGRSEWALAPAIDDTLFCRYWTAKEAVLKAVGTGLSGLARCSILEISDERHLRLSYGIETWTVSHSTKAAHHLAAITVNANRLRWHFADKDEA